MEAVDASRVIVMGIQPVKQPEKRKRCEETNAILASYAYPRDEVVFLDAGKHTMEHSPVVIADLTKCFDPFGDFASDGLHPNDPGAKRMAEAITEATDSLLRGPSQ